MKIPKRTFFYDRQTSLEWWEKYLPKLSNKFPSEYQKIKTAFSEVKEIEKQLVRPLQEKQEEVLWKFFYKKGKMLPSFSVKQEDSKFQAESCETCSSELETLIKPHLMDQIEEERIKQKFEKATKEINEIMKDEFSVSELGEFWKDQETIHKDFIKNKEKELNNKILRERERAKMARMEAGSPGLSVLA